MSDNLKYIKGLQEGFLTGDEAIKMGLEEDFINKHLKKSTDYKIKDSGTHQEYGTGAKRDNSEMKGAFHLLPWESIWHLAMHYEKGAQKYAERNWEKGIPVARYCEAISRHMTQFQMGMDDENHLVAVYWNIASLYQTLLWIQRGELPEELYNMPYKVKLPEPEVIVKAREDIK